MTSPTSRDGGTWTVQQLLVLAFLGRVFFVLYSRIHDYFFEVHFTDIDYLVFSEAAELVRNGKSPYGQPTYRYTPLISWLLLPNWLFADFGKLLFCAVDVFVGWLQLRIMEEEGHTTEKKIPNLEGFNPVLLFCWLFNPFTAIISARGNADAIICALMLATLFALNRAERAVQQRWRKWWLLISALIHGAGACHFRIFPLIYLPSIFLSLMGSTNFRGIRHFIWLCLTNKRGILFILFSLCSLALSIGFFYLLYGQPFLHSAFLYHLGRTDIRHNFSPYFLPLYLTMDQPELNKLIGLLAFVPQLVCIAVFALKYPHDLPFCWFLTTFAFVSYNKVCTSQYFVWYLCFLPLLSDRIQLSLRKASTLLAMWLFGQAFWLLPAYLLEFRGWPTFTWIWLASLTFLAINTYIMIQLIRAYQDRDAKKRD